MKRLAALSTSLACLAGASPTGAQGKLELLPAGLYRCALPGHASGRAWVPQPARDFTIKRGSRYTSAEGGGSYLMKGATITLTSGPLRGVKMRRISSGLLQNIERDGTLGRLRCHRAGDPE